MWDFSNWVDYAWRVVHTFWQSWLAAFAGSLVLADVITLDAFQAAAVAGLAAALSAVKGLIAKWLNKE